MKTDRVNERLDRIKNLIGAGQSPAPSPAHPKRYRKLAEALGGVICSDPAGLYCLVRTVYPIGHRFGRLTLGRDPLQRPVAVASFTAEESEGEVDLDRLLFIDTETTGLGGTGAVPFLIGCGSVTDDGFEVRQYLLPDYSDEAAMLENVLTEFGPDRWLVSYNGRAFDMNLIRDRMIVNRVAREVPATDHFDLLHSARRLFRRRLGDCSLTNIEREIFSFHRKDDIPGYLIPSVYFDWLDADRTDLMESVLEHNRLDILALYFLLLHIDEIFAGEGEGLDHIDDSYSLARVYGRRRCHDKAAARLEAAEIDDGPEPAPDILLYRSLACKRTGDWTTAVRLWEYLAERADRTGWEACIELAKYHEHRSRDHEKALASALRARDIGAPSERLKAELGRRLTRLKARLKSSNH